MNKRNQSTKRKITFATRRSRLAQWQTSHVLKLLQIEWPHLIGEKQVISTRGDRIIDQPLPEIGGKGLFTLELEEALLSGKADAAVHSLKDLPTENPIGLTIGTIPIRADANDALISVKGLKLDELPEGAIVGTSSLRRAAQLLALRPDLSPKSIRGNIETRIRKVEEGQYDAIVLAVAGVRRLGLEGYITQQFPMEIMLPAPGQGALAVQCRSADEEILGLLSPLDDADTRAAVMAERAFLAAFGGGCSIPVGAYAQRENDVINMKAIVASPDGRELLSFSGSDSDPTFLGNKLAQEAIAQGALGIINV